MVVISVDRQGRHTIKTGKKNLFFKLMISRGVNYENPQAKELP